MHLLCMILESSLNTTLLANGQPTYYTWCFSASSQELIFGTLTITWVVHFSKISLHNRPGLTHINTLCSSNDQKYIELQYNPE